MAKNLWTLELLLLHDETWHVKVAVEETLHNEDIRDKQELEASSTSQHQNLISRTLV